MMLYALSVVLLLLSIWMLAGDNWTEPRNRDDREDAE